MADGTAPRVSVIVPTHSRPILLRRAVASILAQSFADLEVIVVDDAGEDPSEVLRGFDDDRLQLVRHTRNGGLAAARNTGLVRARGEYIAYLDDDDYYLPEHCARLVALLEHTGAVMAYSDGLATEERWDGDVATVLRKEQVYSRDFDLRAILCDNFLPVNAAMHRRSVLVQTGGFDESLRVHEDWEHWIRLAGTGGRIVHDPTVTCEYTTRPGTGNMRTQWHARFLETFQIIHHRYAQAAAAVGVAQAQAVVRHGCSEWARKQVAGMTQDELVTAARSGILRRLAHGAARLGVTPDAVSVWALLDNVLRRVPGEADAWIAVAAARRFTQRPADALAALGEAVKGGESDVLYAELALTCADLGRTSDAERFAAAYVARTGAQPAVIEPPAVRCGVHFAPMDAQTPAIAV